MHLSAAKVFHLLRAGVPRIFPPDLFLRAPEFHLSLLYIDRNSAVLFCQTDEKLLLEAGLLHGPFRHQFISNRCFSCKDAGSVMPITISSASVMPYSSEQASLFSADVLTGNPTYRLTALSENGGFSMVSWFGYIV